MPKCKKKGPKVRMPPWYYDKVKMNNSFMRRDTRPCLYCGKPKHIGHFCYKKKYKKHENEKDDDNYVFIMRNGTHSKSVCKWIMDS